MIEVKELNIKEIKLIKTKRFHDDRGFFQQNYNINDYIDAGIESNFIQDNWSRSKKGTLRGLHYQLKNPQSKLIQVICGEVYDVAVDMRINSPTFGQWIGEYLSEENGHQLYIPKGFAHGFLALSSEVDFIYKCDNHYIPNDDFGVCWNDKSLDIDWPLDKNLIISNKDKSLPLFKDAHYFE